MCFIGRTCVHTLAGSRFYKALEGLKAAQSILPISESCSLKKEAFISEGRCCIVANRWL